MLDIIPALLVVTGVVFLVLIVILNKTLYKPLLDFMDNRDKSIAKDLEGAGKNSSDVLAYKQEAEKIILDAKNEANQIREAALTNAKEVASKKIEAKKSQLEEEYNRFAKELKIQRDELKAALLQKLPVLQKGISVKLSQI
ncbi:MAG: FoF1 ATP synthase subunit B' [Campylobacteraceae bacterium]|nr:FoF1 ATP synthase subunit B' [Campylobacteraceae bacterium]